MRTPSTIILLKMKQVYLFVQGNPMINHFIFICSLKLYGRNEKEIDTFVKTGKRVTGDIGMCFSK